MFCPLVEFANQVWETHLKNDIIYIDNVQCRTTKLILELSELSYLTKVVNIVPSPYTLTYHPQHHLS